MTNRYHMNYRSILMASTLLALLIVALALVGRARAAEGGPLTCADVPVEQRCVLLDPVVRLAQDVGSSFQLTHPYTEPNRLVYMRLTYQDVTGTVRLSYRAGLYSGMTGNLHVTEQLTEVIPIGFEGTLLITSTEEFSASLVEQYVACNPNDTHCQVITDLVAVPTDGLSTASESRPLTRYYSVSNPLPQAVAIENRFYVLGQMVVGFGDHLAAGETKVYDMVEELKRRRPFSALTGFAVLAAGQAVSGKTVSGAAMVRSDRPFVADRGVSSGLPGGVVFLPGVRR
ncbi:MAG TPA: hypothetical protein VFS21_29905 [Roseiflexaceae bacterium]|nr:hypothetical protein [Roseiflexaceae bacterium]